MKKKNKKRLLDFLHYILLLAGLFGAYFIGDSLLDFQGSYSLIKMFLFFLPSIIILDKLIHKILGV